MRRLVVLLALAAACSKGSSEKKPAQGSAGSAGSAAAPAPVTEGVALFVDGQQVGSVTDAQAAAWPRVDTLVPVSARRLGKWQTVILTGDGQTQIESPSQKYPELVPALFPGKDGHVAFGYFDPVELAKKGNPQVRVDHLKDLRVVLAQNSGRGENETGEGGGTDPAKLELTIKTAQGVEQKLLGTQLLEMPRQPPPGDNGGMGWPLAAILDKAGVKGAEKIIVSNATTNLTLEKQDLDATASVPFVKLNRQGSLRFIVFKKAGDAWNRGGDLRELSRIEVVK